jgi:protease-4
MHEVARAIRNAAKDDTIKAFAAKISDGPYGFAEIQEIHEALQAFRDAGKRSYAYSASFGDFSNGMMSYAMALGFDEIVMMDAGQIMLNGFQAEIPYFKKPLERIGVEAQLIQRKEYKTAAESILRDDISPAQVETYTSLINGVTEYVADIFKASKRGMDGELQIDFTALIRLKPYYAEEALSLNMIDNTMDQRVFVDELAEKYGIELDQMVHLFGYQFDRDLIKPKNDAESKTAALIFVNGAIMPAAVQSELRSDPVLSGFMSLAGGQRSYSGQAVAIGEDIAATILEAADDEEIAAIILRVNSPGGSPTASEHIRNAVSYARGKGKYVVVTMSDVAASGGYWVSVDADQILAYPTTITGSIGVFGGKLSMEGLWDKLDVHWARVGAQGRDSGIYFWSQNTPYNAQERDAINAMMDETYEQFIARVAKGRALSLGQVEDVARGRVWLGLDALDAQLLDGIGGMSLAKQKVTDHLEIERDALNLTIMPRPMSAIEAFLDMLQGGPRIQSLAKTLLGESSAEDLRAQWLLTQNAGHDVFPSFQSSSQSSQSVIQEMIRMRLGLRASVMMPHFTMQ